MGVTTLPAAAGLTAPHLSGAEALRTPALVIDRDRLDRNITATLDLLGGDADRWRPHLKTAKLALTMRRLVARGVRRAKVATPLELETACAAGFTDVVFAYAAHGPSVATVRRIAEDHPATAISVLVEDAGMVAAWRGAPVSLFIDLNSGMDRTGIALERHAGVLALALTIGEAGLRFAGLHMYDGHAYGMAAGERERLIHAGYDRLAALVERLRSSGVAVPEVITAGTPAFPHAAGYARLEAAGVVHRLSPGTVVYNDVRSLEQLPPDAGYAPAVFVLSRVVSHPLATRFTCDAGHKSVSADAGVPTCAVAGHPEYAPRQPSEEHLPIDLPAGTPLPPRGALLWLVPMHVCPTVNNFDHAVIVSGGAVQGVERVTARGRHEPLAPARTP
jgi:D-serine deaminase-like pyridoxal phosphate-dependent protein